MRRAWGDCCREESSALAPARSSPGCTASPLLPIHGPGDGLHLGLDRHGLLLAVTHHRHAADALPIEAHVLGKGLAQANPASAQGKPNRISGRRVWSWSAAPDTDLCPSLTNWRMACASRSQSPEANPWYAMSKKAKWPFSSISLEISDHCSGVGSTPVGLWAHACSRKTELLGALYMSSHMPSKSRPRVCGDTGRGDRDGTIPGKARGGRERRGCLPRACSTGTSSAGPQRPARWQCGWTTWVPGRRTCCPGHTCRLKQQQQQQWDDMPRGLSFLLHARGVCSPPLELGHDTAGARAR